MNKRLAKKVLKATWDRAEGEPRRHTGHQLSQAYQRWSRMAPGPKGRLSRRLWGLRAAKANYPRVAGPDVTGPVR